MSTLVAGTPPIADTPVKRKGSTIRGKIGQQPLLVGYRI